MLIYIFDSEIFDVIDAETFSLIYRVIPMVGRDSVKKGLTFINCKNKEEFLGIIEKIDKSEFLKKDVDLTLRINKIPRGINQILASTKEELEEAIEELNNLHLTVDDSVSYSNAMYFERLINRINGFIDNDVNKEVYKALRSVLKKNKLSSRDKSVTRNHLSRVSDETNRKFIKSLIQSRLCVLNYGDQEYLYTSLF